ncbi:MAG TPA: hypothetical protein VGV63_10500 [Acidimicrobiales bacterium]|nr:hypothetical protein [Acidimicrobiales bacterium]
MPQHGHLDEELGAGGERGQQRQRRHGSRRHRSPASRRSVHRSHLRTIPRAGL